MTIIHVPDTDSFDLWRQKTNLLSLQQGDFARIANPLIVPITGLVTTVGTSLNGAGTLFQTELAVGTRVKDLTFGTERVVVEITTNTSAKTDIAFSPALASTPIVTLDIVTVLNSIYTHMESTQRRLLITAIAMS